MATVKQEQQATTPRSLDLTSREDLSYLEAVADQAPGLRPRIDLPDALTPFWRDAVKKLIGIAKDRARSDGDGHLVVGEPHDIGEVWNKVMGDESPVLCVPCFIRRAEANGPRPTGWHLRPEGT